MRAAAVILAAAATLAAAALAACSRPAAQADKPEAPPAPTVFSGDPMPTPKAGSWRLVAALGGQSADTKVVCLKGEPLDPLDGVGGHCATVDVRRGADGAYKVTADCTLGGAPSRLTETITGDPAVLLSVDATVTSDNPPTTITRSASWTYQGDCPVA